MVNPASTSSKFNFNPGCRICVVGKCGSGKTTLVLDLLRKNRQFSSGTLLSAGGSAPYAQYIPNLGTTLTSDQDPSNIVIFDDIEVPRGFTWGGSTYVVCAQRVPDNADEFDYLFKVGDNYEWVVIDRSNSGEYFYKADR